MNLMNIVFARFLSMASNEAISVVERIQLRQTMQGKEESNKMQVHSGSCRIEPKCFGCIRMIHPAIILQ